MLPGLEQTAVSPDRSSELGRGCASCRPLPFSLDGSANAEERTGPTGSVRARGDRSHTSRDVHPAGSRSSQIRLSSRQEPSAVVTRVIRQEALSPGGVSIRASKDLGPGRVLGPRATMIGRFLNPRERDGTDA